jgi:hypothetical protein
MTTLVGLSVAGLMLQIADRLEPLSDSQNGLVSLEEIPQELMRWLSVRADAAI